MDFIQSILQALPPGVAEALQGALVSGLVSVLRRLAGERRWGKYGPWAKIGLVGVVAAGWSGALAWMGGLKGAALSAHVIKVLLAALGVRQIVKAPGKALQSKRRDSSLQNLV